MGNQPQDRYKEYYAEKLWKMIPAVYRHEDGVSSYPGVLRSFVEVVAEQTAIVRRSHDRLWDDQYIELCDDWAVPYIADLVGTRLVSVLNKRGRRIDVAKTIYYRRRKGTLRILEELLSDIAGWEGTLVENFRRLARTRHGLDPHPLPLAGRISGTQPGGWADLRRTRAAELISGPFDEFHYTPDFRRHRGLNGRYSIPKLAFYLYRIPSFRVENVTPFKLDDNRRFKFDPSGRDIKLFAPRSRTDPKYNWNEWRSLREWELPGPIRCRVLADDEAISELIPNAIRISDEPDGVFYPDKAGAADLSQWPAPVDGKHVLIDPECGRFLFTKEAPSSALTVSYHYGFSGEIGAGGYPRHHVEQLLPSVQKQHGGFIESNDLPSEGVVQINDSARYDGIADPEAGIRKLIIQAANFQRPYIRLKQPWRINSGTVSGSDDGADATLIIDGIWLGGDRRIILEGDYEIVILRHSTLDPGEMDSEGHVTISPLTLIVEGHIEKLLITQSIIGCVESIGDGVVEEMMIEDSIVQAIDESGGPAIALQHCNLTMNRVTVFGEVKAKRLTASEALVTGVLEINDIQAGCFRFSAAPESCENALPRSFRPYWIPETGWVHYFTSQRFGDPGYAQLSAAAPEGIRTGAENGSEIGAFNTLLTSIKLENLDSKVQEYLPFGLISIYTNIT